MMTRGEEIVDSVVPDCRWDWWKVARAELIRLIDEEIEQVHQPDYSNRSEFATDDGRYEW